MKLFLASLIVCIGIYLVIPVIIIMVIGSMGVLLGVTIQKTFSADKKFKTIKG
jgi:uncharacterized membrane protein